MRGRENQGWAQVATVMGQIARHGDGVCKAPTAASADEQVWSPYVSAAVNPKVCDPAEREYQAAVLKCYLRLPGTESVASRLDRTCARALFRRGVRLDVVTSAMVVAVARRTFRRGDPLPRVRALHYFLPVIDELLEFPCDPGYVEYLEHKLQPLVAAKAAQVVCSAAAG